MQDKQETLGQYFTKIEIVKKLLDLLFCYKKYNKDIEILEPSSGTGNFIKILRQKGFRNVDDCEIDSELTKKPFDFFNLSLKNKYDFIVGNPPFSKYNVADSYFSQKRYLKSEALLVDYLTKTELKKEKEKIENAFILKSLRHLRDKDSTIGFVLPISFFIKNKNKNIKNEISKHFSTIIIYQNDKIWFDRNIPCCFAIFTNVEKLKDEIILIYENSQKNEEVFNIKNLHEELIPRIVFHKNNGYIKNDKGIPLKEYLEDKNIKIKKSYKENNVSAKNILAKNKIPSGKSVEDYKIAVVRVGNASVGKCGLINAKRDTLNDMFYIFDVKDRYKKNKQMKEIICKQINERIDYFRNITCRVGSKSIKKEDIYNFKVII